MLKRLAPVSKEDKIKNTVNEIGRLQQELGVLVQSEPSPTPTRRLESIRPPKEYQVRRLGALAKKA